MKKNFTPFELTLIGSGIISVIILVVISIVNLIHPIFEWISLLIIIPVLFLVCFLVIYYLLEIFIYRKIKLIYKIIHDRKSGSKPAKKINLQNDVIQEVDHEVSKWAETFETEVVNLQKAETFRREFLSNVSHELKTPVFNMQGYLHSLIDGGIHDPEINEKYLLKASHNLDYLINILKDLEIISHLEAGESPLEISRFAIDQLIHEVFDTLEIAANKHQTQLRIKEGCDRSIYVMADREKIKQVLTNLVSNAIKYGKEGGRTTVGFYDMDENILVEITDDGPGIDAVHLPRLFERFYRVDKSRSRSVGGSGLGLAIVKHIIEAHKQTVNVRSTQGIGTTFGFTLKKG